MVMWSGPLGPKWTSRDSLHVLTLSTLTLAFVLVQVEVPDPYLDEIFHIPQTQRYRDGDFQYWDPAITTPPGLYLLTAIPLMTLHVPCWTPLLRLTNLIFSATVIPALLSSLLESHHHPARRKPVWSHVVRPSSEALVISSFPLIFFFSNLYYTDVASLAGVFSCLALAKNGRHWSAALIGSWSMTVRQTNVIWVAFAMAVSLLDLARELQLKNEKQEDRRRNRDMLASILDPSIGDLTSFNQLPNAIISVAQTLLSHPRGMWRIVLPYMLPFGGFLIFLKWNGGIVLGHKEQHEAVLHLPQLLYFTAFDSALLLPTLLSDGPISMVRGALTTGLGSLKFVRRVLVSAVALIAMLVAVHKFTMYHPFLLADNRHYVFYLLRKVFLPYPMMKYAVTPAYLFAAWAWLWRMGRSATVLWLTGFLTCTALVLVPSPLIEPRYFIIPTIILRIQASNSKIKQEPALWAEYAYYVLINLLTVGLFLTKKFRWEGWEGWMRFMW